MEAIEKEKVLVLQKTDHMQAAKLAVDLSVKQVFDISDYTLYKEESYGAQDARKVCFWMLTRLSKTNPTLTKMSLRKIQEMYGFKRDYSVISKHVTEVNHLMDSDPQGYIPSKAMKVIETLGKYFPQIMHHTA